MQQWLNVFDTAGKLVYMGIKEKGITKIFGKYTKFWTCE